MIFQELINSEYSIESTPKTATILDKIPKSFSTKSGGVSKFFADGDVIFGKEDVGQSPLSVSPVLLTNTSQVLDNNNNSTNAFVTHQFTNTTQDINNTMTFARPLDSLLPTDLFNLDPITRSDQDQHSQQQNQNHSLVDPSHWNSNSLTGANWSYIPTNSQSSGTSNEYQSNIGQRTIVDNNSHQRQLSDFSMNSLLSFGSNFEDWANYVPTGNSPISQKAQSNFWEQRASFSSNGSGMNSIAKDGLVSSGTGLYMEEQMLDPSSFTGVTTKGYSYGGSTNEMLSAITTTSCPLDINEYFGSPITDKMDVMKSLNFFRRSLGDNLPSFNVTSHELAQYHFCLVCFKDTRLDLFNIPKEHYGEYNVGDLVIVQADRGVDLGKLVSLHVTLEAARLFKTKQNADQRANGGKSSDELRLAGLDFPRGVLRVANGNEVAQFPGKEEEERAATCVCQEKVVEYGLNLVVDDCEYQWDKNKLTFYYQSDQRVDFRDLIREMFRLYKARIWLCKATNLYTRRHQ